MISKFLSSALKKQEKKRLYVHIGLHKTGSTSIQVALQHARAPLLEKGILYPISICPTPTDVGHHYLAWAALERPQIIPDGVRRRYTHDDRFRASQYELLKQEIQKTKAHTVILSGEEFDNLNNREILNFCSKFKGFDVVPVVMLRNSADVIESSYKTALIYSGFQWEIEPYMRRFSPRMDVYDIIKDWRAAENCTQAIIINYDAPYIRRDSITVFFDALGLDAAIIPEDGLLRQNESTSSYACELARLLRFLSCGEDHIQSFVHQISSAYHRTPPQHDFGFMSDAVRADLLASYNQQLAKIMADPDMCNFVYGKVGLPPVAMPVPKAGVTRAILHDSVEALMALSWDLQPKEERV